MSYLNAALRALFDALLYPFRGLAPIVGLVVLSFATAIGLLMAFKVTSDQEGLAAVKRRIHACLFEIRLFNDDFRAILRAQGEILRHNLTYLRLSLVPMVWIIVPLALVIAQLQFHYGYRGLEPGEKALVTVALDEGWEGSGIPTIGGSAKPAVRLEVPPGLEAETPSVWVPADRELSWRISAHSQGDYELIVDLGAERVTKTARVTDAVVRRSPVRTGPGLLGQFLYPAEAPLPADSAVRSITLTYPEAEVSLLGWKTHWMVAYFILAIAFAFALRNRLGVQI